MFPWRRGASLSWDAILWLADVTYRVHHSLSVFNRLQDPLELKPSQRADYLARPCKEKPEGFSFPEDLLPSCTKADSNIPLMTLVNCVLELLRSGGNYVFLQKLWGHFRASSGAEIPLYELTWSRAESLVNCWASCFLFLINTSFRHVIVFESKLSGFAILCLFVCFSLSFFGRSFLGCFDICLPELLPSKSSALCMRIVLMGSTVWCAHGMKISFKRSVFVLRQLVSGFHRRSYLHCLVWLAVCGPVSCH